jgi:carbon-monoxide dehydrogenase large subunit
MYKAFQNLVASTLGIGVGDVTIDAVGADPQLTDKGAGGSRVTSVAGGACVKACRSLLEELDGIPDNACESYWIADRLAELGKATVSAEGEVWTDQRGTPMYGGVAVQVGVDRATGKVSVQRAEFLIDAGDVWNEVGFRGQVEGGFVFGLSQTLYEALVVEEGQVLTASLGDYKIACIADVPPLTVTILPRHELDRESDEIRGGVGEIANLGVPAAVANAIQDAVGVRVTSLPITAEAVWRLLHEASDDEPAPETDRWRG